MDKSTKINGPIFQISKISKKDRNKSYPSKTKKMFKIVSNEKNNSSNNTEDKK
jgi:hypothetical protein